MRYLYKIYVGYDQVRKYITEAHVERQIAAAGRDATIYHTRGLWHGQPEGCVVAEVITAQPDMETITRIASYIRQTCDQQCVLVTEQQIKVEEVTE
jgi:hypothetical protein